MKVKSGNISRAANSDSFSDGFNGHSSISKAGMVIGLRRIFQSDWSPKFTSKNPGFSLCGKWLIPIVRI